MEQKIESLFCCSDRIQDYRERLVWINEDDATATTRTTKKLAFLKIKLTNRMTRWKVLQKSAKHNLVYLLRGHVEKVISSVGLLFQLKSAGLENIINI